MKLKEYIKAIRLPACIFAGLTTIVSFKLTGHLSNALLPAISTITIFAATMAQNDLRDRWHDRWKGKTTAYDHPDEFRLFVICLWILAVISSLVLCLSNPWYMLIAFAEIVIGLAYSELQRYPLVANSLVAIAMSLATMFPLCDGAMNAISWFFVAMMTIAMFGREILKDFDDKDIDRGFKWTLIQRYGENEAKFIAVLMIFTFSRLAEIFTLPVFLLHKPLFNSYGWELLLSDPSPEMITETKFRMDVSLAALTLLLIGASG